MNNSPNINENIFNELLHPGKETPTLSLIHSFSKNQELGNMGNQIEKTGIVVFDEPSKKQLNLENAQMHSEKLQSTMGTKKMDNTAESSLFSNSDIFFSGCFGPKEENGTGYVQSNIISSDKVTLPFTLIGEEREKMTCGSLVKCSKVNHTSRATSKSNYNTQTLGEISNGSFLGTRDLTTTSALLRNGLSFEKIAKSVSFKGFHKNKKVLKTSEDILLEKIKKETEEVRRLKYLNIKTQEKSKNYTPQSIVPSPLTLIKPFNLSSSTLLMKKRLASSYPDIISINNKIKETIKRKCEKFGESMKESVFINDKIVLNKTPENVKYMKRTAEGNMPKSKSKCRSGGKSPLKAQENEGQSLSSRIDRYCEISKNKFREAKKSPLEFNRNLDEDESRVLLCQSRITNNTTTIMKASASRLGMKKKRLPKKKPLVESFAGENQV